MICFTWMIYSIVAPLEIAIVCLYWVAEYDGSSVTYLNTMKHGVICLLVLFDGTIVTLIPMRLKHYPYYLITCILYLLWSLLVTFGGIGNGEWGPAYDDDEAFYSVLRWKSETQTAIIVSSVVLCVIAPLTYFLCWILSILSVDSTSNGTRCCCFCRCFVIDGSRRPLYKNRVGDDEKDFEYKGV